jgi:hypothetical protein
VVIPFNPPGVGGHRRQRQFHSLKSRNIPEIITNEILAINRPPMLLLEEE